MGEVTDVGESCGGGGRCGGELCGRVVGEVTDVGESCGRGGQSWGLLWFFCLIYPSHKVDSCGDCSGFFLPTLSTPKVIF